MRRKSRGMLALEALDLRELFECAASRFGPRADARGISIHLVLPDSPAMAMINKDATERVLENLISNALKFSPANSVVTLSLRRGEGSWLGVVRDEGMGVPPDDQQQLFQKFHRGSNRPVHGDVGAGLGLFIVQQLLDAMNGSIEYAGAIPHGAIFRFRFPIEGG